MLAPLKACGAKPYQSAGMERNPVDHRDARAPLLGGGKGRGPRAFGLRCAWGLATWATMTEREAELIAVTQLSGSVKLLRFRICDGEPLAYVPGQWLNLRLPDRPAADKRAYSIACAPDVHQPGQFELAVTHVAGGVISPTLHTMRQGERVWMDGPYGFFTREAPALFEPALFVGTGTGIAPLRAMLQSAFADVQSARVPMTLLFGCRTQADILFKDEIEAWAQAHDNFTLHVTLSKPDQTWAGFQGYVQHHVAHALAQQSARHVYVCGLSAMVQAVRHELKALGLGRGAVHTERYD